MVRSITTALALALLAGCGDPPTGLTPGDSALHHAVAQQADLALPITGRCETTFNPPSFPPPPVHTQTDVGTCTLAHLGRAAFYSVKEINFMAGTQTTTEASLTAANGDILRFVGSGASAPAGPGQIGFTASITFTGGTGRFTDAQGEAQITGVATLATTSAVLEITDGWITYGAAARR
jgi:hypothetical protein